MIVVDYKLTGTELLTRMQVVNAVKRALRQLGEYWHEAFAWKRFTPIAYTEYGFKVRSSRMRRGSDRMRKLPLVHTGEAREQLLSESTVSRIRVTRDTVRIPMPTKLNRYNPRGPNMADEVRRVSKAELSVLQENLVVWIETELNAAVPAQYRNRGFSGGQVKRLRLSAFRPVPSANPVERRTAA